MISIEVRAILAALERVLYLLLSLVGLGQALGIKLDKTATESTPYRIQGQVDWIGQQLTAQPWSLPVLHNQLTAIIASLDGLNAPVLEAIAALPAGSDIVIPGSDENAGAVWDYPAAGGLSTLDHQNYAGSVASNMALWQALPLKEYPGFGYAGDWSVPSDENFTARVPPTPDWGDILPADTRLTWLNRTDTHTWFADPASGEPWAWFDPAHTYHHWHYVMVMTEGEFQAVKAALSGGAGAPIWPGLAKVTLGTPVALGADVTIPGPLDGVLIALTTPPSGLSNFSMGGQTWYYRAGQVAFVSDNGDTETWQYITWTNALYCPRQMVRAASAILRGLAGVEGTVTPWLTV
jgi:hypothetical protein